MQRWAEAFYKSRQWKDTREAYARSKRWLCEDCLKKGRITAGEIVHHIKPLTPDSIQSPEISLSWNNLKLVCRECHAKEHGCTKRYKVDEMGRVII